MWGRQGMFGGSNSGIMAQRPVLSRQPGVPSVQPHLTAQPAARPSPMIPSQQPFMGRTGGAPVSVGYGGLGGMGMNPGWGRFAEGGGVSAQATGSAPPGEGLLRSHVPGREDRLPMSVPVDSYVIPADIVSALGQGNTDAGAAILDQMFRSSRGRAAGGRAGGPSTDIVAAGGEYVVPPAAARRLGGGDAARGHDALDKMVKRLREQNIKRLRGLPGPAR